MSRLNFDFVKKNPKIAFAIIATAPIYFILKDPEIKVQRKVMTQEQVLQYEKELNQKASQGALVTRNNNTVQKKEENNLNQNSEFKNLAKKETKRRLEKKSSSNVKIRDKAEKQTQKAKTEPNKDSTDKELANKPILLEKDAKANLKENSVSNEESSEFSKEDSKNIVLSDGQNLFIRFKSSAYFDVEIFVNDQKINLNSRAWVIAKISENLLAKENGIEACFFHRDISNIGLNAKNMIRIEVIVSDRDTSSDINKDYSISPLMVFISPTYYEFNSGKRTCKLNKFTIDSSF